MVTLLSLAQMNIFLVGFIVALSFGCAQAEVYRVFEERGKFGLKNTRDEILIPARYDALGWSNGEFSVIHNVTGFRLNDLWGLVSIAHEIITPAEFFSLYPGSGNLLMATRRSPLTLRISAGCVDTSGKVIIPFNYSGITLHSMRAIVYTLDGNRMKYGLIDMNNKVILPQLYQYIYPVGSLRYAVQNFKNKTALFSENGKAITNFSIDSLSQVQHGLAILYQNGYMGLIDRAGKVVKEPVYREVVLKEGTYYVRLPDEWSMVDATNKLIRKIEADSVVPIGANRTKIVTAQGTRLTDKDFKPVGNEIFQQISPFKHDLAVYRVNGKAGVLRSDGTILLPAEFDHIQIDENHLMVYSLQSGKRTGWLYDLAGNKLSAKPYDKILPFNGTIFPVVKGNFQGGINKAGQEVIACAYDSLLDACDDLAVVKFRGQYGIINLHDQWVVTPQPHKISLINKERFFEHAGNLTFLKGMDGSILYFTSNKIELLNNRLTEYVTGGGKWTINLNGQIVHREQPAQEYAEIVFPSSEGYRGIKRNGRYGFIDELGRLRIANRYEGIMPFSNGLAAVKIRGKWGFINKGDNIVIQPVFEEVDLFTNGFTKAKQNGKYGMIDGSGKVILEFRYDKLHVLENMRILICSGRYVGLADADGNVLLQPKYDSVEDLGNGYAIVKQHEKFGLVSLQGISTIPIQFDQLIYMPERNVFLGLKRSEFTELKF
jgi:hypothetical protein